MDESPLNDTDLCSLHIRACSQLLLDVVEGVSDGKVNQGVLPCSNSHVDDEVGDLVCMVLIRS